MGAVVPSCTDASARQVHVGVLAQHSRRDPSMVTTARQTILLMAAGRGALAGLAGVTAMTVGENLEQRFTGRPNS